MTVRDSFTMDDPHEGAPDGDEVSIVVDPTGTVVELAILVGGVAQWRYSMSACDALEMAEALAQAAVCAHARRSYGAVAGDA